MEFTGETFRRFAGGQFEVRNPENHLVIRGKIKTAAMVMKGGVVTLNITPEWMARGTPYPNPTKWTAMINIIYKANPLLYTATDIGGGRVQLHSEVTGETTVLHLPGQIILDPSRVDGL